MSLLMQSAMSQGRSPATIRAAQKSFQRELDRIGDDVNKVRQLYQRRIEELSKQI